MDPGPQGAHTRRQRTLAWLTVTLVAACSLPWTVLPWYDATSDGSVYIVTARALAAGEGYSYLGIPFVVRMPGFSCLLAPILAWRGTDFVALNLEVGLFGVLGVVLFHFLVRERLGLVLATLVPLVLWFNPSYQQLCNQVMSDVPGWALLVACVLLAQRFAGRYTVKRAFVLGVVVGLASYVRSNDVVLVPALLCAGAAREAWGRSVWGVVEREGWRAWLAKSCALLAGALLVLAPWAWRNHVVAPPPPADQTLLYSYSSAMWHADMGDPRSPLVTPAEVLGRFPARGAQILQTLGMRLGEQPAGPWNLALGCVLLAALLAGVAHRRAPEDLFALATLCVMAFFSIFAARVLLPVFACALASLVELVRAGGTRVAGARAGTAGAALLCLVWLALDWRPHENWDKIRSLHEGYVETAQLVNANVPPTARLGAWRGWTHTVYLERPVYSFEFAARRGGGPSACEALIDKYALDTVMLSPLGLPALVRRDEQEFAQYIVNRYGGNPRGIVRVR